MEKVVMENRKYCPLQAGMIVMALVFVAVATLATAPCPAGATNVVDIATGHGTSIALTDDGRVWTWGNEWHGVLGRKLSIVNPISDQSTPKPIQYMAKNLTGVTDIAAGLAHIVALKNDGTVLTWGYNLYGQLGDGTIVDSEAPRQVKGLDHVKAVAAGLLYSLALKDDGTVWAWGYNKYGQLGTGSFTRYELTPVQVTGLSNIVRIYAGYNHNVAIDAGGNAWAWGSNDCGELGDGTNVSKCTPERIAALSDAKDIALGSSYTVAIKSDGTARAWGENYGGWLGDGTTTLQLDPVKVRNVEHAKAVATGEGISFASQDDGTVMAWGLNIAGTIGNGNRDQRVYQPGRVGDMSGIVRFAVGPLHVLGLKADGSLLEWGDNQFGEMGLGEFTDKTYTPRQVTLAGPDDPLQATATPAATPGNDGNVTNDLPANASGGTPYMQYGIIALMCLVIAACALVWYSRR